MTDTTSRGVGDTQDEYRPLTMRERQILDFLLSVDTPGVEQLRQQAGFALAKPWDCGCASIDLVVDQAKAPPSSLFAPGGGPAVEAEAKKGANPLELIGVMLWVQGGWLSAIELSEAFEPHTDAPKTFPPPENLEPPTHWTSWNRPQQRR